MSVPTFDLNKAQFASTANSFKNDGQIYTGTIDFVTSIPASSFQTVSQTTTLSSSPVFSMLYGYYQEYIDTFQQYYSGSGYNAAQWYDGNVDNKVGFLVTAPLANAGPLEGLIYPVINGNQVTVTAIVNNPYGSTITLQALSIPWAFIEYTLTN